MTLKELVKFLRRSLIFISYDALKEEQARGFDKKPVLVVDGKRNKPITDVKPFGKVEFVSRVAGVDIARDIYAQILKRSPVVSGNYLQSNFVFLNGKQIATNMQELEQWIKSRPVIRENDFLRFVNVAPYARRLERLGVTKNRTSRRRVKTNTRRRRRSKDLAIALGLETLAPNGTYFLSTRAAKRKYKNNVSIYFGFIPGSQLGLNATFKTNYSTSRKKKSKPRTYLYPTIKVYFGSLRGLPD